MITRGTFASIALGLTAATSGCGYTADDVRSEPIRLSMTVPSPLERMVTCIKSAYIDEYSIVDLPNSAARRTELVLHAGGHPNVTTEIFDLQSTDRGTTVVWRRQKMVMNQSLREDRAHATVERCGREA
jgi:hypothetical protein